MRYRRSVAILRGCENSLVLGGLLEKRITLHELRMMIPSRFKKHWQTMTQPAG